MKRESRTKEIEMDKKDNRTRSNKIWYVLGIVISFLGAYGSLFTYADFSIAHLIGGLFWLAIMAWCITKVTKRGK